MTGEQNEFTRRHRDRRWWTAVALALLSTLPGCASILDFPQNVPAFNDGFGKPSFDEQERIVEWDVFTRMPGFGDVLVELPPGMTLAHAPFRPGPLVLNYTKNRSAGIMGTRWRKLTVSGDPPLDGQTLRLPVPRIEHYHPQSLMLRVRAADAGGDMRVLLNFAETEIVDPNDVDRHSAFWRDQDGQCLARGRLQPLEYASTTAVDAERYPLRFDTTLRGLCVFRYPTSEHVVATDTPGQPLRSHVRLRIPEVYQRMFQPPHQPQPFPDLEAAE